MVPHLNGHLVLIRFLCSGSAGSPVSFMAISRSVANDELITGAIAGAICHSNSLYCTSCNGQLSQANGGMAYAGNAGYIC